MRSASRSARSPRASIFRRRSRRRARCWSSPRATAASTRRRSPRWSARSAAPMPSSSRRAPASRSAACRRSAHADAAGDADRPRAVPLRRDLGRGRPSATACSGCAPQRPGALTGAPVADVVRGAHDRAAAERAVPIALHQRLPHGRRPAACARAACARSTRSPPGARMDDDAKRGVWRALRAAPQPRPRERRGGEP